MSKFVLVSKPELHAERWASTVTCPGAAGVVHTRGLHIWDGPILRPRDRLQFAKELPLLPLVKAGSQANIQGQSFTDLRI